MLTVLTSSLVHLMNFKAFSFFTLLQRSKLLVASTFFFWVPQLWRHEAFFFFLECLLIFCRDSFITGGSQSQVSNEVFELWERRDVCMSSSSSDP